ncbi:MAG: RNA polymerase sigma factor [Polyangiaceae bacterium]
MTSDLHATTKRSWHRFLDTYEPLRPELYRYCRHLTRSPWDAEDLAQDTLARAFVTLAQMKDDPASPRAWLFRVASNLWIDHVRRRREVPATDVEPAPAPVNAPQASREAAGTLLVTLSPQERAAVVLKDVFELSLDEVAEVLTTTVGAVKTALHRARGKLVEDASVSTSAPVPGAVNAFCRAFNAGDLEALASLLLDSSIVEVVGATTEYGPEAAKKTVLWGMLFGTRILADPNAKIGITWSLREGAKDEPPRVEARFHRDRWVLVHWYRHSDGDAVRAFTTVELDGDRICHLRNWFYNAELLVDLGGELDVPVRVNGNRWWWDEARA